METLDIQRTQRLITAVAIGDHSFVRIVTSLSLQKLLLLGKIQNFNLSLQRFEVSRGVLQISLADRIHQKGAAGGRRCLTHFMHGIIHSRQQAANLTAQRDICPGAVLQRDDLSVHIRPEKLTILLQQVIKCYD